MDTFFDMTRNLAGVTLDLFVLAGVFVALFIIALYFGKKRILSLILSLYIAIPIFDTIPNINKFLFWRDTSAQVVVSKIFIFSLITSLVFYTLSRIITSDFSFRKSNKMFQTSALSSAALILLLIISYFIIPIAALYNFSPTIDKLFAFSNAPFWWLVASIVLLFVSTRK